MLMHQDVDSSTTSPNVSNFNRAFRA